MMNYGLWVGELMLFIKRLIKKLINFDLYSFIVINMDDEYDFR